MNNLRSESNRIFLEEYALTIAVSDNDDKAPKDEPQQEVIENMARVHILNQGIHAIAAFEVVLFLKRNLKARIRLDESTSCRLLSTGDVLIIVKHAMGLLKSVFEPYSERLKKLSVENLREICQRIAGVFHRESEINILTGSGISFTGITKLYYDCTSLHKVEATKMLCGIGKGKVRNIYYINRDSLFRSSFPGLKEVEGIVASVMGSPSSS